MTRPKYTHSMELPLRLGERAVQGCFDYTSTDPHAVGLTITDRKQTATWPMDRGLLRDGCLRPAGVGDVQVKPGPHASKVLIRLSRPGGGNVTLEASWVLLSVFVSRIYAAVPEGREDEWATPFEDALAGDKLADLLSPKACEEEGSA